MGNDQENQCANPREILRQIDSIKNILDLSSTSLRVIWKVCSAVHYFSNYPTNPYMFGIILKHYLYSTF